MTSWKTHFTTQKNNMYIFHYNTVSKRQMLMPLPEQLRAKLYSKSLTIKQGPKPNTGALNSPIKHNSSQCLFHKHLKEFARPKKTLTDSPHIRHLQRNHNCINVLSDPCSREMLTPQALVCFQVSPQTNRDIMVQRWGIYVFCTPLRLAELMGGLTDCRADDKWYYICR